MDSEQKDLIMNNEHLQKIEQLYDMYKSIIKPLLAEIEANYEQFPLPLLNEIRAFNDHLSRCYGNNIEDSYIKIQLNKAESHINRTILDCYKFLNVYYNDRIIEFERQTRNIDLGSVSNGEFYLKYKEMRNKTIQQVRKAKIQEHNSINENNYEFYELAYNYYVELNNFIDDNLININWAKAKFTIKFTVKGVISILLWVASIIISCILTNNNQEIIDVFINMISK